MTHRCRCWCGCQADFTTATGVAGGAGATAAGVRWCRRPGCDRFRVIRCEQGGSGTGAGDRGIRRPEIAIAIYRVGMDVIKPVPPDDDVRPEEGRIADSDDEFWSGQLTNIAVWRA